MLADINAAYEDTRSQFKKSAGLTKKGKGRARHKLDPDAPKKPANAFFMYCQQQRNSMHGDPKQSTVGHHELTKHLAKEWKTLGAERQKVRAGSSLICKEGCRFSMGCCMREPYHPLSSAICNATTEYGTQKVDSSNRSHTMIHHQNADAMVLASARLRGIPPLDVHHFEYYQGGECLSNAHWPGPWRQHLMTGYAKIIGKS